MTLVQLQAMKELVEALEFAVSNSKKIIAIREKKIKRLKEELAIYGEIYTSP